MKLQRLSSTAGILAIIFIAIALIVVGLRVPMESPTPEATPSPFTTATPIPKTPVTLKGGQKNTSNTVKSIKGVVGKPRSISIPKINVATVFEPVGLDKDRNMDVPKDGKKVGWYALGAKPGGSGNAVVSGHLDAAFGPAIFWKLKQLTKGDEIVVTDENNKTFTYIVKDKVNYPYNQFPLQDVFGKTSSSRLNLITCSGSYNRLTKNYSQRLVVYTELKVT